MKIGNVKDFMQQQSGKVKERREEMKRIKKGIYQMQVMLDAQESETLMKECDRAEAKRAEEKKGSEGSDTGSKESKKTDPQTEMEKMLSTVRKGIALNSSGT